MNKKGENNFLKLGGIFIGLVIAIIGSLAMMLILYSINYGTSKVTNSLVSIPATDPINNISGAAQLTFGQIQNGIAEFQWISYLIMFGMFAGCIIASFLVRIHKAWAVFYIIFMVVLILLSIYISRSYENMYLDTSTDFNTGLSNWGGSSFILLNLPAIVTAIGLLGCIPLFTNLIKDRDELS